jgi:hypothetical protein
MRAASQASAVLDGPSTSGRCTCNPKVIYTRRRGRLCIANAGHMPIGMHNTEPIPGFRPKPSGGVVGGARTTATPRLTPERVRLRSLSWLQSQIKAFCCCGSWQILCMLLQLYSKRHSFDYCGV